jgi:hypothetical protein
MPAATISRVQVACGRLVRFEQGSSVLYSVASRSRGSPAARTSADSSACTSGSMSRDQPSAIHPPAASTSTAPTANAVADRGERCARPTAWRNHRS